MGKSVKDIIIDEFKEENREVIDWTLYDSQLIATASARNDLIFFQNTVGGVGRARTNMHNQGVLPSPESFLVTQIWCLFLNSSGLAFQGDNTAHDQPINVFISQGYWSFYSGEKMMVAGSLNEMRTQEQEAVFAGSPPDGEVHDISPKWRKFYLRKPIVIGSVRQFRLEASVVAPAAGDGYSASTSLMYWYLRGLKRRNA